MLKYPKFLIDKSLQKARKNFYSNNNREPFVRENILTLPYNVNLCFIKKLLKIFKINVVYKNSGTLQNIIVRNSPKQINGSIYTIPCAGCSNKYLSQTGKELDYRLKQHRYAVRTGQLTSALFVAYI